VGLTILLLVLARIGWRLTHRPSPLPAGMPLWERALARTSHGLFYVLLLVMPLTGWAMVSARKPPIHFWGLPWPRLPGLAVALGPQHKPLRQLLQHVHVDILIWIVLITLGLHVAGALKHQFDGRPVLWRMGLGRRPRGT
jgi:cytochrome b561